MIKINVQNAGLVLLNPFMPQLYSELSLTANDEFADAMAAGRAARLLQYIAGANIDAPEYDLSLNKILCGIPIEQPISRSIDVSDTEAKLIASMLTAVIAHWSALGDTSTEGLQESFLLRDGHLMNSDNEWRLIVSARPFDMLLDRLPWSFQTMKLPWMNELLHVDWR